MPGDGKRSYPQPYLWPVGPAGLVAPQRVLAAASYHSAPIRRAARLARQENRLIDLTFGRACRWVLFLDSGHLVLAAVPMPVTALEPAEEADFLNAIGWNT